MEAAAQVRPQLELPPMVPGAHPLLGHLPLWREDLLGSMDQARETGDVVRARLGPTDLVYAFDPESIERILVSNASNYGKDTRGYRKLRLILGDGLVTSEGEAWRAQRRIANPAFRRKAIAGFADAMVRCTTDLADDWEASAASGETLDVAHEMMHLTLRIACLTFFSSDLGEERGDLIGQAMEDALAQFHHLVSAPFPWPELMPTPGNYRFWRGIRTLDRVVAEMVEERRQQDEPPHDLLSMFIGAVDDETGKGMTDVQLRDELVTMLGAGHETTANGLAWTLALLGQHPEWARRVADELDEVLGGRPPTVQDLRKLDVTQRVLSEAMRLRPPVPMVGRKALEDDVLGGYHVPGGTYVFVTQWVTHRHPDLWEDPEGFDPDRFLPERCEGRPKHAYFPFLSGQRKCIGDRFAQMEMAIALAVLLQRFRLELVPGQSLQMDASLTLRPRHGVRMRPRAR